MINTSEYERVSIQKTFFEFCRSICIVLLDVLILKGVKVIYNVLEINILILKLS